MMLNRKHCLGFTWCHQKYIVSLRHRRIHQSCIFFLRKPSSARKVISSLPNLSNMTDSGLLQTQKAVSYGNTNFYGIEGDEGVIHTDETPNRQQLIQDSMKNILPEPKREFKTVSFGAVRLDSENLPTYYARNSVELKHPEIADGTKKAIKENMKNDDFEFTSTSVPEYMTPEVDSLANNINTKSMTEQNLSSFLSDIEKNRSVNHVFQGTEEPETKFYSNSTFEKNQADSCSIEKSNFIDEIFFPSVKDKKVFERNEECAVESENDISFQRDNFATKKSENQQDKRNSRGKSSNYIDEQYFPEAVSEDLPPKHSQTDYNYIDKQYFNDIDSVKNTIKSNDAPHVDKPDVSEKNVKIQTKHMFDEQYSSEAVAQTLPSKHRQTDYNYIDKQYLSDINSIKNARLSNDVLPVSRPDVSKKPETFRKEEFSVPSSMPTDMNYSQNSEKRNETVIRVNKSSGSKTELQDFNSASKDQTETAYDFVMKLRKKQTLSDEVKRGISAKKEKKVDSKGFRILKHQVPSLMYFTRDEMLELLKNNILYIDDDIVVLNKPYNLIIHESSTTKNNSCLSMYLNDFAQLIGERNQSQELFTVHRLDKETTGCLLLARNKETAQRMKSLFAQRKIIKTYWIVTTKVPDPMKGVIDIPISEGKIGERSRMVLHPDLPPNILYVNHSKCGKRAVTSYDVIATSGNAALVEVKPETGIKHQIRVHFGFGLACPILGDHKYSYLDKFVPQKLPSDLLQRLHVRQSKVRHIPLHIHSKHILLPQYADQRNLYVTAPLPHHMSENLQFLKFKKNK